MTIIIYTNKFACIWHLAYCGEQPQSHETVRTGRVPRKVISQVVFEGVDTFPIEIYPQQKTTAFYPSNSETNTNALMFSKQIEKQLRGSLCLYHAVISPIVFSFWPQYSLGQTYLWKWVDSLIRDLASFTKRIYTQLKWNWSIGRVVI